MGPASSWWISRRGATCRREARPMRRRLARSTELVLAALHLSRSSLGVVIEGDGRLAFCPCLGTPLTVAFSRATVAPPGDLFLKNARLEIFGLPVLWLPY